MTESDEAEAPPVTVSRMGGRAVGVFAILFALAGLAGFGYLYYALILQDSSSKLAAELAVARSEQNQLRIDFRALETAQRQATADLKTQQDERLAETERSLIQTLNELANQGPPSEREWKLAEVEYLLRVANHRVLMEQDFSAALDLLEAADQILLELDDFSVHAVRAELADEILNLQQVTTIDVQGLYLRLDAVKRQLEMLALAVPEYALVEPPRLQKTDSPSGFLDSLATEFRSLLRFRRLDQNVVPLLAPEEATYLDLNLRLMLEQAQLAALKSQQVVFETSLDTALEWVLAYLDTTDPQVIDTVLALEALRGVQLELQGPDVSGSLNELLKARRGSS
ncbi:MAG: uroporphyrinogen-III C-methyltransferase [Gammaproteobacteria bacterium]|nr:uroporphyrinogen-III C-methyltransferase [Gammaproteobacteria bacterium]